MTQPAARRTRIDPQRRIARAIMLCSLGILLGCARPDPAGKAACADAAGDAIVRACRIVAAAPAVADLWPGFWPEEQPFLLTHVDTEAKLLYWPNSPPPAEFAPLRDSLPRLLRGRVHLASGFDGMLAMMRGFSPAEELDGTVLPAMPDRLFEPDTLHGFSFLYHEFFHTYQETAFAPQVGVSRHNQLGVGVGPGQRAFPENLAGDSAFLRELERERRLLARALRTEGAARVSALEEYAGRRRQRSRRSDAVRYVENGMEATEGTATWVGDRAALIALGRDPATLGEVLIERWLAPPLDSFPREPELDAHITRWRLYGTGAALAELLTELGVHWQGPVARGDATLFGLLQAALADPATEGGQAAAPIRAPGAPVHSSP